MCDTSHFISFHFITQLCIAKQRRAKILEVGSLFHKNYFSTYGGRRREGARDEQNGEGRWWPSNYERERIWPGAVVSFRMLLPRWIADVDCQLGKNGKNVSILRPLWLICNSNSKVGISGGVMPSSSPSVPWWWL
jgi:hypothetical protein